MPPRRAMSQRIARLGVLSTCCDRSSWCTRFSTVAREAFADELDHTVPTSATTRRGRHGGRPGPEEGRGDERTAGRSGLSDCSDRARALCQGTPSIRLTVISRLPSPGRSKIGWCCGGLIALPRRAALGLVSPHCPASRRRSGYRTNNGHPASAAVNSLHAPFASFAGALLKRRNGWKVSMRLRRGMGKGRDGAAICETCRIEDGHQTWLGNG
jgi:hypothetical protein